MPQTKRTRSQLSAFIAALKASGVKVTWANLLTAFAAVNDAAHNLLDDVGLIGLKQHSTDTSYPSGWTVLKSGSIYKSNKATSGAFLSADWDEQMPTNVPRWIKVVLNFEDFNEAAEAVSANVYELPAKGVLHSYFIETEESFAGGGITTADFYLGTVADDDLLSGPIDAFAAPSEDNQAKGNALDILSLTDATTITAALKADADLDGLNQGIVNVWLLVSVLP